MYRATALIWATVAHRTRLAHFMQQRTTVTQRTLLLLPLKNFQCGRLVDPARVQFPHLY